MSIQRALQRLDYLLPLVESWPGQHAELKSMTNSPGCDICEHVPTLYEYATKVESIVDMGVRFGWSTRSLLAGLAARSVATSPTKKLKMHSYDLFEWNSIDQSGAPGPNTIAPGNSMYHRYAAKYRPFVDYKYTIGDSTKVSIEECDLLFIDTFHHGDCLKLELKKHGNLAKKYIIMHDTETFGQSGQDDPTGLFFKPGTVGGPGTGLWDAILPWLKENPWWNLEKVFTNNNGLTVLARK